jgi:hypothetical protein
MRALDATAAASDRGTSSRKENFMGVMTHTGSCHCGTVRFEVDADLAAGTGKCNCSVCAKLRKWGVVVKPEAFRLLAGAQDLTDYQFNTRTMHHTFCRHCGVHAFGRGYVEELGGAYYSVNVACLDDITAAMLAGLPVQYFNGRDNDWFNVPKETRHL